MQTANQSNSDTHQLLHQKSCLPQHTIRKWALEVPIHMFKHISLSSQTSVIITKLQPPKSRYYTLRVIAHLFFKTKSDIGGATASSVQRWKKLKIILVTTFYHLSIQDIKISRSSWLGNALEPLSKTGPM